MPFNFDSVVERRSTNSCKWTTYPEDVLPLWVADMDFKVPEPISGAMIAAIQHGVFGYEFVTHRTRKVVAERLTRLYGWQVDPDWVVETIGVVHGFHVAARALCERGSGLLIQPPVYHAFYRVYPNIGITPQYAPFSSTATGQRLSFTIDFNLFRGAFHSNDARTKMFLLCHPHNPMGRVFTRDELTKMAEITLEHDAVIVSDEIHCELGLGDQKHIPVATLSEEIADRCITLFSPSKTFNLCGLFCGFAIISNEQLRARFRTAMEQSAGHVSSLSLIAAEEAFSGSCDEWLKALGSYLKGTRDEVLSRLAKDFPKARFAIPEATYLEWIDFGEYVRSGEIPTSPQRYFLENAKVALNDGKTFGEGYENYVRLNFGAPRSIVHEALDRMSDTLLRN